MRLKALLLHPLFTVLLVLRASHFWTRRVEAAAFAPISSSSVKRLKSNLKSPLERKKQPQKPSVTSLYEQGFFDNLPNPFEGLSVPGLLTDDEMTSTTTLTGDDDDDRTPFDPSPDGLVRQAKLILAADFGLLEPALLDDARFTWMGPYVDKPLGKTDYLVAGRFFNLKNAFPDLNYRAHDFRIDETDIATVRCTCRTVGTMRGELRLRDTILPPTGTVMRLPPEAVSMTFDLVTGKLVTLKTGYCLDRLVGNTRGTTGVIAAAITAGQPISDFEIYPPLVVLSRVLSRPQEPIPEATEFLAPFPETVMIQLTKGILTSNMGEKDPSLLSDTEFSYMTPSVGPIGKAEFIEKYAAEEFRDVIPTFTNYRVDPYDPVRVWVDVQPVGIGYEGALQAMSFAFDNDGFCTRITSGAVIDPSLGNGGGLGGTDGLRFAQGDGFNELASRPLPRILGRVKNDFLSLVTGGRPRKAQAVVPPAAKTKKKKPQPPVTKPLPPPTLPVQPQVPAQLPAVTAIKPKPPPPPKKKPVSPPPKKKPVPPPAKPMSEARKKLPSPLQKLADAIGSVNLLDMREDWLKSRPSADEVKAQKAKAAAKQERVRLQQQEQADRARVLEVQRQAQQAEAAALLQAKQDEARARQQEQAERARKQAEQRAEAQEKAAKLKAEQAKAAAEKKAQQAAAAAEKKAQQAKEAEEKRAAAKAAAEARAKAAAEQRAAEEAAAQARAQAQAAAQAKLLEQQRAEEQRAELARAAAQAKELAQQRAADQAAAQAQARQLAKQRAAEQAAAQAQARAAEQQRAAAQAAQRTRQQREAQLAQAQARVAEAQARAKRAAQEAEVQARVKREAEEARRLQLAQQAALTLKEQQAAAAARELQEKQAAEQAARDRARKEQQAAAAKKAKELQEQRAARARQLQEQQAAKQAAAQARKAAQEKSLKEKQRQDEERKAAAEEKRSMALQKQKEKAALDSLSSRPSGTFSLFGLTFGDSGDEEEEEEEAAPPPSSPSRPGRKAPFGVPTISRWRKNLDGSVSGFVRGSLSFTEGEKITTSRIEKGTIAAGEVVTTGSGSRYFLEDPAMAKKAAAEARKAAQEKATKDKQAAANARKAAQEKAAREKQAAASARKAAQEKAAREKQATAEARKAAQEQALREKQTAAEARKAAQEQALRERKAAAEARKAAQEQALKEKQAAAEARKAAQEQALKEKQAAAAEKKKQALQKQKERAALSSLENKPAGATFPLFGFGGGDDEQPAAAPAAAKKTTKKAPRGVPTVTRWRKNRDGSISGLVSGSRNFSEGERITTSKIAKGTIASGEVVTTGSGSRYFLA